jgi:hypothetical protein
MTQAMEKHLATEPVSHATGAAGNRRLGTLDLEEQA